MNGIHDMGGMHGFGPIQGMAAETAALEQQEAHVSYYERWLETLEKLAIARGLVTLDELDARTAKYAFNAHDEHED
jgi:hypothetical protein